MIETALQTPVQKLSLRPADEVMKLERLGSLHPFRLSFMRTLVRRMSQEKWNIERSLFDLDDDGYGTAMYAIQTSRALFTFVVFAHDLDPSLRSDRVIANQWDMTVTLCEGTVDEAHLKKLRENVPLQEGGRVDSRSIVLSRANKSVRNFAYVVNELSAGRQPGAECIAKVGYLYRTTAVYGSGKFGMADWQKVYANYPDLGRPFAAEMLSCYLIREFSLDQAEFLAAKRAPQTAVELRNDVRCYFGIGNATGLGMAPFLINHPGLISRWIEARETALARIMQRTTPTQAYLRKLVAMMRKAAIHLHEISTDNSEQHEQNSATAGELRDAISWLAENPPPSWRQLVEHAEATWNFETQEILNSLLMELCPDIIDGLEDSMCVTEDHHLDAAQQLDVLIEIIEKHYAWALSVDFSAPASRGVFWYRSKEKMEPRLGQSGIDAGEDKAMSIDIAYQVRQLYDCARKTLSVDGNMSVGEFALSKTELRSIVRRVQNLSQTFYGDIQANLVETAVLPIHLLRCKLSFFGVSKFDPKSRLWVRNTMFQGAPCRRNLDGENADEWYFPVMPDTEGREVHDSDVD